MDFDAWLGVEVIVGTKVRVLPDRVKRALAKAWTEDILEEDDVPTGALDDADFEDFFATMSRAYADGARLLRAEKYTTDEGKWKTWFTARFSNGSAVLLSGTTSKITITPEFQADMDKQGMSGPEDLLLLELSLLLGRAVVASELAGGNHGQPPGAMAGAVASAKTSKALGFPNARLAPK